MPRRNSLKRAKRAEHSLSGRPSVVDRRVILGRLVDNNLLQAARAHLMQRQRPEAT
jgi:hypothetical protein